MKPSEFSAKLRDDINAAICARLQPSKKHKPETVPKKPRQPRRDREADRKLLAMLNVEPSEEFEGVAALADVIERRFADKVR